MFDIHQSPIDEDGDWDDGRVEDYCNGAMDAFAESPEGTACAEYFGSIGWTQTFLYYAFSYLGTSPTEMSQRDIDEILFDLFPRKTSTEPETANEIVGELRAFWQFLEREYQLANAPALVKYLNANVEQRLKRELSNPDNFGIAKSFVMMGQESGFDMTTQEGMNQFMAAYNASLMSRQRGGNSDTAVSRYQPPVAPPAARPARVATKLSIDERKSREKLRRQKLGKPRRKRR
ncbi:MAG: hypothetical protein H6821_15575 [Planctomycetaceae bacterium]|nr:hypothetical protein [Planctomycetales bacterium]MCB9875590.1 hypothetical protein [Planctomycetaceae bacterium]MCB9941685.1 hypothetical protein [Planctomycetaceae bacterium]